MKQLKKILLLAIVFCPVILVGCGKMDPETPHDYFALWNSCEALTPS